MKVIFTILIIFCAAQFSQAQNPYITSILNEIKIDSLVNFVENISGEKGVVVNGNLDTIYSRHKSRPGNELAFKYIIQEFERFGLQTDSMIFSATGKNALAIQPGTLYPDKYYIICSHYDGMPNLPIAAAADDDGSGVAATLEAARVLSKYQFEYTIIYAIWDEEEQGKVGSLAYANLANTNNDSIMGVINMDAIAWDSDSDDAAMIHVKPIGTSFQISDTIQSINTDYSIGLNLAITNPGATYSDHASFWTNGFGAVLVIEDWTFDSNPNYHTDTDLLAYFNLPYFLKLAKLSLASVAALATPMGLTSVRPILQMEKINIYPNPFTTILNLDLSKIANEKVDVRIYDIQGKIIIHQFYENTSFVELNTDVLERGTYLMEINSGIDLFRKKLIK
jgi:hypothetical protein